MTFGHAADAYIASLEARITSRSFRSSTLRTYRNIIDTDLRPLWNERPVGTITRDEIDRYRAKLVARNLAATTINQTRAVARGIFAMSDLDDDPSVAFTRAKTRRATSGAITFYRPDELQQLAAGAADEQDAALYLTAAFTGLRASELRALRWRSVDFADSLLHVERGFTDEGGEDLPKSYRVRWPCRHSHNAQVHPLLAAAGSRSPARCARGRAVGNGHGATRSQLAPDSCAAIQASSATGRKR